MKTILVSLVIIVFVTKLSSSAKVFSCDQGCKDDGECPTNSHCVAVNQNSECGMCLCKAGYKTKGSDCVSNKGEDQRGGKSGGHNGNGNNGGSGNDGNNGNGGNNNVDTTTTTSATAAAAVVTTTASTVSTTQPGPTTQGPPPTPVALDCANYNCPPAFENSDSDNPFTVRAHLVNQSQLSPNCRAKLNNPGRSCNMKGGGTCYGVYCLKGESGSDYCICDQDRVDRQCAVEKPGKCQSGTSQLPQTGYRAQGKRYQSKNDPENGSIYGRHFSASFDDCVKACTWTGSACRAVNYRTISGQKVCEMLSSSVSKGSILESWMVNDPTCQYATIAAQ